MTNRSNPPRRPASSTPKPPESGKRSSTPQRPAAARRTGTTTGGSTGSTIRSAVSRSAATTERRGPNANQIVFVLIVLALLAVVSFPFWRPLLISDPIAETFAGLTEAERGVIRTLPGETVALLTPMMRQNPQQVSDMLAALQAPLLVITDQIPPGGGATPLAEGSFNRQDVLRGAAGKAVLYRTTGPTLLRLEDLTASAGPEMHVYLALEAAPTLATGLGTNAVDIGPLRGTGGSQNYILPDTVNVRAFGSVVLYDQRYGEVYSAAPLTFR